ncbi:MAG: OB-fold domain-containing protein [Acidobacteriota bacterium]
MTEEPKPRSAGVVYTETVVYSAPEAFLKDAPYQIAIVTLDEGGRVTARILGERVAIGDQVSFVEHRDGVPYFRKSAS